MRKSLIWIILSGIFSISCTTGFEIKKSQDLSNPDLITYSTSKLSVKSEYKSQTFYTHLQFSCFKNKDKRTYLISSSYTGNSFPNLQKVVFIVNTNEEEIIPERKPIKELEGVLGKTETITVQVPEHLIINLYEENNILMKVAGNDMEYEVHFSDDIRIKLRQFYEETI